MKKIMIVMLCMIMMMSIAVLAESDATLKNYQDKKMAYDEAQKAWKLVEHDFAIARPNKKSPTYQQATAFIKASIEKIIAHLTLAQEVSKQTGSIHAMTYERPVHERIKILESLHLTITENDSKIKIIRDAEAVRVAWDHDKVIIKEVLLKKGIQDAGNAISALETLVGELKKQQGVLKQQGTDTIALDEQIKQIEMKTRKTRELMQIAEKRSDNAKLVPKNNDKIFAEGFASLREAKSIGIEALSMIRKIDQTTMGGAV